MPGFASIVNNTGSGGGGYQYGVRSDPADNIRGAANSARGAMNTLGVPDFGTLLKQFGGFAGSTEFGNAGAAGAGADFEKQQLQGWQGGLADLRNQIGALNSKPMPTNQFAGDLRSDRADYANPTKSAAFQAEMGLAREQTGAASAQAQRNAAEAAQRRGYQGGYDPRATDLDRMQALSEAGFAGVKDIRDQALSKYGTDASGYTAAANTAAGQRDSQLKSLTDLYSSGVSGYNSANQGFAGLAQAEAELPTKMISALGGLGGLFGGPGGFFSDALNEYDSSRAFNAQQRGQDFTQSQAAAARGGGRM